MPTESELVDPIRDWLRREYGADVLMLIHEKVRGREGRRPDLLVVISSIESNSVDDVTMILVEIENSSRVAIHDPRPLRISKIFTRPPTAEEVSGSH
jgi:hypothetical protein